MSQNQSSSLGLIPVHAHGPLPAPEDIHQHPAVTQAAWSRTYVGDSFHGLSDVPVAPSEQQKTPGPASPIANPRLSGLWAK